MNIKKEKIFLTNHHNNVLPYRRKFWMMNNRSSCIIVIHIDQHSDLATPRSWIDESQINDESYIKHYAHDICNIWNFIKPALEAGIIQECIQIRTETALLEFKLENLNDVPHPLPAKRLGPRCPLRVDGLGWGYLIILDIDIDFRAPEMVNASMEQTFQKTKDLISQAHFITIATSPGFIDQDLAQEYVKKLLS